MYVVFIYSLPVFVLFQHNKQSLTTAEGSVFVISDVVESTKSESKSESPGFESESESFASESESLQKDSSPSPSP